MEGSPASFDWSTFWSAVSAIATAVAALGIFFAGRQLKLQAWIRAQDIWMAKEFKELRGWIFAQPDGWTKYMSGMDYERATEACRRLDEFARLAPYLGWCPPIGRRNVLAVWADPLAKLWAELEPVVAREREQTGWATKWDAFQHLGVDAADYLTLRAPDGVWRID